MLGLVFSGRSLVVGCHRWCRDWLSPGESTTPAHPRCQCVSWLEGVSSLEGVSWLQRVGIRWMQVRGSSR